MNVNKQITEFNDPYFDEVKSKTSISFDFVLWFYRILKYWYLFVISICICLGIAYLKNKSWIPFYAVRALVMLEQRGNTGIVSGAVPTGSILRSTSNQQTLLQSYGMAERTVKKLPAKMFIDYYQKDYFKSISIYSSTPLEIETITPPQTNYHEYNVTPIDEYSCMIYYDADKKKNIQEFSVIARYGEEVKNDQFAIKVNKTKFFKPDFTPFSFRFLTESQLIGIYNGRVVSALLEEEGSALIVMLSGSDPYRDIDYLNTLLSEFENYNLYLKNQQAELTISFIDKQLSIIKDSLDSSKAILDQFQKETGVYEITSKDLRSNIDKADLEKENLAIRERAILILSQKIKETILGNSEIIRPSSIGLDNNKLEGLIATYNETLDRAKYLGAKNPLYNKMTDELNASRVAILEELHLAQTKLQEEKDSFVKKYELLELRVDNLPPQEREFLSFERDYKVNEVYHQFLTQKKYEAQIQKASNTPDNFVWENPRIFSGPTNGGVKGKNYMFYCIVGLIIPFVFIILKEEVLNFTIATKEECEKISGLPVIGTIENIAKKLSSGVVLVKNYPKSSFAESFRNMRVRIEYMARRESNISVLVTSTEPGDGKTFIATNIASVYQLIGKKVVIVDLDLRRPSVAKTLQLENKIGVSNYLIGQVSLEDIIISNADYGFDIISAGTLPPNPSELIKTEKTRQLIEHLKQVYDYVIIDCSPVGLVSDAYILARMVDTTIFVVRRAKTNKSFFKSVINQLRFDGIENAALVFNDVKGREGYYGTSRYYGNKTYYLKKNSYYHDDYFEK